MSPTYAAEIVTSVSAAESSNCIISAETFTYIMTTEISTNITLRESTTCRKYQFHSSNRNYHLQNWLQKLSLATMVPVKNLYSYRNNIETMSKHRVLGKIVSVLFVKTNGETWQRRSSSEVFLGKGVLKICSKYTGEHLL